MSIQKGSLVELKSGSDAMTVSTVNEDGAMTSHGRLNTAMCVFFANGMVNKVEISLDCLKLVDSKQGFKGMSINSIEREINEMFSGRIFHDPGLFVKDIATYIKDKVTEE